MKVTVISIIFLFTLSVSSSLEVEFIYPQEIEISKPFEVHINSNQTIKEKFDVKIYVDYDDKEHSLIFNPKTDEWISTNNYLINSFPNSNYFYVKSFKSGDKNICLLLRESKSKQGTFKKCYPIKIYQTHNNLADITIQNKIVTEKKVFYQKDYYVNKTINYLFIILILILIFLLIMKKI